MKTFKHTKTGKIANEESGEWYKIEADCLYIPKWVIEGSCDWEEVKEKDYEILSFKVSDNSYAGQVIDKCGNFTGNYGIPNVSLERALEKWPIHSIKRLSDGEIFTVGDKVCGDLSGVGTITQFNVFPNILVPIVKCGYGEISFQLQELKKHKKKEYEILSFYNSNTGRYYTLECNGTYFGTSGCVIPYEQCINRYIIHSVRRLSDGEVFTRGDKVRLNINKKDIVKTISSFNIGGLGLMWIETYNTCGKEKSTINNYCKAECPLFTTEDGVPIYEGEEYWIVNSSFDLILEKKYHSNYGNPFPCKAFAIKTTAEEYIELNKPKYSHAQLKKAWNNRGFDGKRWNAFITELKSLL